MLHLMTASKSDLDAYAGALDAMYGYPKPGAIGYAAPFGNLAAKADPLDPAAMWAMDISINAPLGDAPNADQSTWPYPVDLDALDPSDAHRVAIPASCSQWDCTYSNDPAYPGWFPAVIGP